MGNAFMTIDTGFAVLLRFVCIFCADSLCEAISMASKEWHYDTLQSQWLLILSILFRPFLTMRFELIVTVYFAANKFMIISLDAFNLANK